jgi:hypothetical protein
MRNIIHSLLLTSSLDFPAMAQVSMEDILVEIEKNNKTLQANAQNTEAQKLASNPPIHFTIQMWNMTICTVFL